MTLEELVAEYHDQLATRWRRRRIRRDDAENVLQTLWLRLAMRPELVARIDQKRNPLAYLDSLARGEWKMLCRSESRRVARQRAVSRPHARRQEPLPSIEGFASSLSDAENSFWLWLVAGIPMPPCSDAYRWQLKHRVRVKLEKFLAGSAVDRRVGRR